MCYNTYITDEGKRMKHKPVFVMMVGLPGSGKTYYAEENLVKKYGFTRYGSDDIREEMGDVNDQTKNAEVFEELHKRIISSLKEGKDTIMDATNLSRKRRINFLKELKGIDCARHCIITMFPYEDCIKADSQRERSVGREVINKMIRNFETPSKMEGFDRVDLIFRHDASQYSIKDLGRYWMEFDQENKHHTLTLGQHMSQTRKHVEDTISKKGILPNEKYRLELLLAAGYHDCMKPICKAFVNGKGEPVESATYYGHHNASAYEIINILHVTDVCVCDKPVELFDLLRISLLINFHMKPYMDWKQSDKAMKRDKEFLGDELFQELMILHEADRAAH